MRKFILAAAFVTLASTAMAKDHSRHHESFQQRDINLDRIAEHYAIGKIAKQVFAHDIANDLAACGSCY